MTSEKSKYFLNYTISATRKFVIGCLTILISFPAICLAVEPPPHLLLILGADYSIFSESERQLLSRELPKSPPHLLSLPAPQTEIVLREIELRRNPEESDEEFILKAERLQAELLENPDRFAERARDLSASRTRFRAGLLSPLTLNQFESEIVSAVRFLNESEVSSLVKLNGSVFIFKRESNKTQPKS